jgi:uridine kinase
VHLKDKKVKFMGNIQKIQKRSGAIVDFTPDRITNAIYRAAVAVGGRDKSISEQLSSQVVAILEEKYPQGGIPFIEEIQDIVEKVLIENGHAKVAKAYILYRDEQNRKRRQNAALESRPSENIPWAKIWHSLNWAVENGLHTIQSFNERIARGEYQQIVHASESAYEGQVEQTAQLILERIADIRIVIITGPSSSGKTTTTTKIGEYLQKEGYHLVTLNVDHYFFNLAMHPKDEFGDYDFETPQALDLDLINQHLQQLIAGEKIMMPYYDFKTGTRRPEQTPLQLKKNEILLIDSLHGLFGKMTEGIPSAQMFRLYLEPLLQMKDDNGNFIRWTDIRLIRRMLRDAAHRAYDPEKTLLHWHYVRASELRNIIPYINTTDAIINSAMPYEMALYAHKLLNQFNHWEEKFKDDPLREDAFIRASRVARVLAQFTPIADESPIPAASVLREFIGGSIYELH